MAFSSGVKLGDLDDFIAASQECVKPLIQAAGGGTGSAKLDGTSDGLRSAATAAPVVEVPQVQRPNLIKSKKSASDPKAEIGQVTLSDCLACSGCVTSAETVLLQAQSVDEFTRRVSEAGLTVVTISAESRASIAASLGEAPLLALRRLATALRRLGACYVLEPSAAEAVALLEGKAEFLRRFRAEPSTLTSNGASVGKPAPAAAAKLPLLTSHCPGWTCYAEKVVDPIVLPHLSPLRPPQQIQGRLVKTVLLEAHNRRRLYRWWRARSPLFVGDLCWLAPRWRSAAAPPPPPPPPAAAASEPSSPTAAAAEEAPKPPPSEPAPLGPSDVYHVAVQPCFDRKIEAARPGFEVEEDVREVDTVLTTSELLELVLRSEASDASAASSAGAAPAEAPTGAAAVARGLEVLAASPPWPMEGEALTDILLRDLRAGRPEGRPLLCPVRGNAEAGGFAEHVFREAARELFGRDIGPGPARFEAKQNEDFREVRLLDEQGKLLLRFVAAFGFRNIQNVIRRITKTSPGGPTKECGHFVEIMACPGGCLNGGGQPSSSSSAPAPPEAKGAEGAEAEGGAGASAAASGPNGKAPEGKKGEEKAGAGGARDVAAERLAKRRRLQEMEASLHSSPDAAVLAPEEHPCVEPIYYQIARLAASAGAKNGASSPPANGGFRGLVGGEAVRRWLAADWRSLKVDEEGKPVVGTSALKW